MTPRLPDWQNDPHTRRRRERRLRRERRATYGFQDIPEAEKVHWVRRHFNSVADHYDFMNTLLSFGIHLIWKRHAAAKLALKPGERVLDVCGGTGDLAELAANRVGKSGRVVVYDINRAMMEAGRRRFRATPMERRLRWVQGDAEAIAFPAASFDAAMVGFGIRNVTRMENGFAEMLRILKPGGRMLCLEFSKPTAPLFRQLYDLYSFHVMPLLGEVLAGSRQAYTHLPETIRLFPLPDELSRLLETIGYERVAHWKLTNGIAVIHIGYKPGA
jgi:demethylmenaquinone methyltransferase/2-methoxy-6-polyprenyl-1,4-benzoquinol methylase